MLKSVNIYEFDEKLSSSVEHRAVVIGAGFGGLAAAMRLGAKCYKVLVIDRLSALGGRGSSLKKGGHRFDLGPTIVTLPNMLRSLWEACGKDFDDYVELKPLDPFYKIKFPDDSEFASTSDEAKMRDQVLEFSPKDLKGYEKFMRESKARYQIAFSSKDSIG